MTVCGPGGDTLHSPTSDRKAAGTGLKPHYSCFIMTAACPVYSNRRTGLSGCVRTQDMDDIWKDSCVEFFVQPKPGRGYFNFEFNCGGAMLGSHITDHERTSDGFRGFERFTLEDCTQVLRKATMPHRIDLKSAPCSLDAAVFHSVCSSGTIRWKTWLHWRADMENECVQMRR